MSKLNLKQARVRCTLRSKVFESSADMAQQIK